MQSIKITVYDDGGNEVDPKGFSIIRDVRTGGEDGELDAGSDVLYYIHLPFAVDKKHWTEDWRRKKEEYSRRTK